MVTTFGNSIFGACTGGMPVKAIYVYGEKVWPSDYGSYYIKWSPANLSGSFTIGGVTRRLEDYSGYYSGPFLSTTITIDNQGHTSVVHLIDEFAFQSTGILAVETNLEFISQRAFMDCSSLVYVSMPNVIKTNGGVFSTCTRLGNVELPALMALSQHTFSGCTNLYAVSLPKCSVIGLDNPVFANCNHLQSVYLPKCRVLDDYALAYNGLSIIELPVCSNINPRAFYSCSSLHTLILGYSGIATLGTSAFSGTKITSTRGSIYVPLSYVSGYRTASGWAYYANIIQPITTQ